MLEEGDAWKNVGAVYGMQSLWTRKNGLRKSSSVSEKNVCFWFKRKGEKAARLGRSTERGMLAMEAVGVAEETALDVLATNPSLGMPLARTTKVYLAG